MRLDLRDILTVFRAELLSQIRDRNTLIYAIVLPIFLYPAVFWVMGELMTLRMGVAEKEVSRVAVMGSVGVSMIADCLAGLDDVNVREVEIDETALPDKTTTDVVVRIDSAITDPAALCFDITLLYDGAEDRSQVSLERVAAGLANFREDVLIRAVQAGTGQAMRRAGIESIAVNLASSSKMATHIMAMLIPLMIVIMVAMGSLYPALDVVVGERERQTLETTLLTPTARINILAGKFLLVVTAGVTAALLNILSFGLLAKHTLLKGMFEQGQGDVQIPLSSYPLMLLAIVLTSIFYAAALMVIASLAKNFKEGQSFIMPFWMISYQPAIVAALPGMELDTFTAFIPVTNVALLFRAAATGDVPALPAAITLLSLVLYCVPPLWLGAKLLKSETLFWSDLQGSWWKKLRAVLRSGQPAPNNNGPAAAGSGGSP